MKTFFKLYSKIILSRPWFVLVFIMAIMLIFALHIQHFRLDASSDSLSLENDQALKYYNQISEQYGSDDYLIMTYSPKNQDLFAKASLADLKDLQTDLAALDRVQSIISILDVPLLKAEPVTLETLQKNIITLNNHTVDLDDARQELTNSILYSDLLISQDGQTTAFIINFITNDTLQNLYKTRQNLREKERMGGLAAEEKAELVAVEQTYGDYKQASQKLLKQDIADIRAIMAQHKTKAHMHLGGVPMIIVDSIDFIEKDLRVFGVSIFLTIGILLFLIFRRKRWVILPILNCLCVLICVIGFLGLVDWPVTIVSANFIALILIFTLSFSVHQIVCYSEYAVDNPQSSQKQLVEKMIRTISLPCAYMVSTTIVAFASLVISDIRPIIDFGWMMAVGLIISFIISFTFFPAAMSLLTPERLKTQEDFTNKITLYFSQFIRNHSRTIVIGFFGIAILSLIGTTFLNVQNRFIDYYKKDTDVYQGMLVIDQKLGGTTPLDIVIDAPQDFIEFQNNERQLLIDEGGHLPMICRRFRMDIG